MNPRPGRTSRLKWRWTATGLGFLGLAAVRLAQDEPVWAAVFAAAAAVNLWLGVHEGAREAAPAQAALPDGPDAARAAQGYRTSARQWQVIGAVGALLGAALLMLEPALAVLAAAAALFSLYRARRADRAAAALRRVGAVRG